MMHGRHGWPHHDDGWSEWPLGFGLALALALSLAIAFVAGLAYVLWWLI
jgi:hypothetical protein